MLVKLNQRGQITLPSAIRKALELKPGDSIAITKVEDHLELRPVTETIFDLIGSIPVDGPQDFAAIREEVRQYVAESAVACLQDDNE